MTNALCFSHKPAQESHSKAEKGLNASRVYNTMNLSQNESERGRRQERESERRGSEKNMVPICFICPGGEAGGWSHCLTERKEETAATCGSWGGK